MTQARRPYLAFAAALVFGVGLAAACINSGPGVLAGPIPFGVWLGYLLLDRLTSIGVGGISISLDESIDRVSKASPNRVQEVAAAEIQLLSDYYRTALGQARTSFNWALV